MVHSKISLANSPFRILASATLAFAMLFALGGCLKSKSPPQEREKKASTKSTKADQIRKQITKKRAERARSEEWVEQSAAREKHTSELQGLIQENLCDAIKKRRKPSLKTTAKVSHTVPNKSIKQARRNVGWIELVEYESRTLKIDESANFLAALQEHFSEYRTLDICDFHTSRYTRKENNSAIIRTSIHLSGFGPRGGTLGEHGVVETTFDSENRIMKFELQEHYRIYSATKLFEDQTQEIISKPFFGEDHFGKLKSSGLGNLDFGGLSVVDVNRDGLLDIYVCRSGPNRFYLQKANGSFEEVAAKLGVADAGNGRGVVFADFDGDQRLDLVIANMKLDEKTDFPVEIYQQQANGKFRISTLSAFGREYKGAYTQVSVADVTGDGNLDIFIAGYSAHRDYPDPANHIVEADNGGENLLFINQGKFKFQEEAAKRGIKETDWSYASGFADPDRDGDMDLYVANDWGKNRFYLNDGQGSFRDIGPETNSNHPGAGMSVLWLDINNDSELDLYVSNMFSNAGNRILPYNTFQDPGVRAALETSAAGNVIYLNPKTKKIVDQSSSFHLADGGWSWGATAIDYDLDGDTDIYQSNGYFTGTKTKDL